MIKSGLRLLVFTVLVVLTSCGQYHKVQKSKDYELRYRTAVQYYEAEKYYRAISLFEDLKAIYKGTDKDAEIQYRIANSYYNQHDYMLASYYFDQYVQSFPLDPRVEEVSFMSAYCYYLDSPKYSLDQENTILAMRKLQLFINKYPNSPHMDECNELTDKLRSKLERKAYETAMLYYKISDYQAAVVSLEGVLKDFPETSYREEIMFHILKASYTFASRSIEEKQAERYAVVLKAYEKLVANYPESQYLDEAKTFYQNSLKFKNTQENGL